MISAVTAKDALRFAVFEGTTTVKSFSEFCKHPLPGVPGPVRNRGRASQPPCLRRHPVRDRTDGVLKLFFPPAYSRELNSDEWVWTNVKHERIGKPDMASKDDLKAKALYTLRCLRKLPACSGRPSLIRICAISPQQPELLGFSRLITDELSMPGWLQGRV
jgi:hypothetical protein